MKKSTWYLLALCSTAVIGAFALQLYWIASFYKVNKFIFEKEINLALEDAVKKEFSVRCDTIQQHIFAKLMDTTQFILSNTYDVKKRTTIFKIADKQNPKDQSYFHTDSIGLNTQKDSASYKAKLARFFSRQIRVSELEAHFVFYHTQKLGNFVNEQTLKYDFDTLRLRPILKQMLADRDIFIPFVFSARTQDSTYYKSHFSPALSAAYPVISKAFITFKQSKKEHFVRAMFKSPFPYIIARMGVLFAGSVILILGVAFSLFYVLKSLFREKKLSAVKNDFISNITHEFKTPIATVTAAVEALTSFDVLNDQEKTHRYLKHSQKELSRLSSLVDRILNISLHENQQFDIRPEQLNVDDIIKTILASGVVDSEKNIEYSYLNHSGVTTIYADKLYFQHALGNVVDNAVKYSGNDVKIEVKCMLRQENLVIAIKDNGIGIGADNLPYIFEKFYRAPSKHHLIKGHGLGLSYVKSIIEKHKGWCKMDSELGKGSILYLAWPV